MRVILMKEWNRVIQAMRVIFMNEWNRVIQAMRVIFMNQGYWGNARHLHERVKQGYSGNAGHLHEWVKQGYSGNARHLHETGLFRQCASSSWNKVIQAMRVIFMKQCYSGNARHLHEREFVCLQRWSSNKHSDKNLSKTSLNTCKCLYWNNSLYRRSFKTLFPTK